MEKKMSGVLISYELFNDENTNLTEKCILSEILKYSDENGICNLNNQYLAQVLHLSKGTVSNIISTLTKKEYIELDFEYYEKIAVVSKRVIKIAERLKKFKEVKEQDEVIGTPLHENVDTIHEKMAGVHKNMDTPHEKMDTLHANVDTLHENMEDSLLKTSLLITSPLKINKRIDKKTRLECLNFLDKDDYRKLNNQTRDNIRKKYPQLLEDDFCNIYKKLCDEEAKGRVKSFNAAIYLAVENKWDFSDGNSVGKNKNATKNENNIENSSEKIQCDDLRIRWFKSCFRGVEIDDYLDCLGKIPYETLTKNRGRLGRMSHYEFKSEFRKLVGK